MRETKLTTWIPHQAGQYLFKVYASVLADKSESFRDMFDANLEATTHQIDGQTEDSPILVPPSVSETAFELFISVCYNKYVGFCFELAQPSQRLLLS